MSLGKPVLVTREVTERPEGVEAGLAHLVGSDRNRIVDLGTRLLLESHPPGEAPMAKGPYGDGRAAPRIVKLIQGFEN